VQAESGTWHYGLLARWWVEFNIAEPNELAYYRAAIEKFGQPALDLGCGTGRFLIPLRGEGLDVDGVDISGDMIDQARAQAEKLESKPGLFVQALHKLDIPRRYRTMYLCGVFGIGGRRDHDREALRRAYEHLEPGGALLIIHELPYDDDDKGWSEWRPGHLGAYPQPWPEKGNRRRSADGDEIELLTRVVEFDPLRQQVVLGMRARLWRDGSVVREEPYNLKSCLYFAQEIVLMLEESGFRHVVIEGNYNGQAATPEDGSVIFVARKDDAAPSIGGDRPHGEHDVTPGSTGGVRS
jgi:SAM-dependent methyltransferase